MLRLGTIALSLALLAALPSGLSAPASGTIEQFLVGHDDDDATAIRLAIRAAGGQAERTSEELGFTVALTSDASRFQLQMSRTPGVEYVERDDATRLSGAQWNGAQWNAAEWNGAQWNGAQWNGAQWNGAQWNGAQWNGAEWNGGQSKGFSYASADPGMFWQWGSWAVRAPAAWQTTMGTRSASVCVIDSGVAWDHPDLAANYAKGWNAIDPLASAYDDAGHGTHIAGIAAAAVNNAFGVAGVGNVSILNAKVLTANGTGDESDLAFGIAWCASQGADVAVMALSASAPGPTLERALQYAAARDVLLVASAGNTGGAVEYPASHPLVLGVGAMTRNGTLASFSSRGSGMALVAPGVDILSTFPGGRFVYGSGTSQAVAFVAGAATLARDAHPGWSADDTRAKLTSTAQTVAAGKLVRADLAVQG